MLQVHTAIDATKSARDNYSISAKVKTTCDFYLTGSVTSGTKVYLSTYTDPFFWIVDSFIQFNGTGTATFTAISSDGFNFYSSYADLNLTEAIVCSLHDSDMQQWQAVKDACNQLTGVTDWILDPENNRINYVEPSTSSPADDACKAKALQIYGPSNPWTAKAVYDKSGYCVLSDDPSFKLFRAPNSDTTIPEDQKKYLPLETVAQKITSNASLSDQAISLLADAYLENVANSIFNADESKQFVKLSDLTPQFELNKILAN